MDEEDAPTQQLNKESQSLLTVNLGLENGEQEKTAASPRSRGSSFIYLDHYCQMSPIQKGNPVYGSQDIAVGASAALWANPLAGLFSLLHKNRKQVLECLALVLGVAWIAYGIYSIAGGNSLLASGSTEGPFMIGFGIFCLLLGFPLTIIMVKRRYFPSGIRTRGVCLQ